jgi:hypothetical protein
MQADEKPSAIACTRCRHAVPNLATEENVAIGTINFFSREFPSPSFQQIQTCRRRRLGSISTKQKKEGSICCPMRFRQALIDAGAPAALFPAERFSMHA